MSEKKLYISTGSDNFRKLVTTGDVFVDKTLLIAELVGNHEEAVLITKPRRWGKTLGLDMLKTFFGVVVDENGNPLQENPNRILFTGGTDPETGKHLEPLRIASVDDGQFLREHQGKYPVIFASLKDVRGDTKQEIENSLKSNIADIFKQHRYLDESPVLAQDERDRFQHTINNEFDAVKNPLNLSLKFLTQLLKKHHHNKLVYVFIDEYDNVVNNLLQQGIALADNSLIREASKLITHVLSSCGKTNDALQQIVMTGILDAVKKEGSSGFTNLAVYDVTSLRYGKGFGFSTEEVEWVVSKLEFGDNEQHVLQNIKNWYDGTKYLITPLAICMFTPPGQ